MNKPFDEKAYELEFIRGDKLWKKIKQKEKEKKTK